MSIKVMSLVWEHYPEGGTNLLALLALADYSDDDGRCFPSISSIAKKIRLKHRQAQRLVHKLINDGYVRVIGNQQGGWHGDTRRYQIMIATLTGVLGDTGVTNTPNGCRGRHSSGVLDDTQTIIEPSIEPSINTQREKKPDFFAGIDPQIVADYQALRKAKKVGPMTDTALTAMKKQADLAGCSLQDALQTCVERGWVGFKAEWVMRDSRWSSQSNCKESGIQSAAKSVFKAEHIQHLIGAQEIEVNDAIKAIAA